MNMVFGYMDCFDKLHCTAFLLEKKESYYKIPDKIIIENVQ